MAAADFSHDTSLAPGSTEGATLRSQLDRLAARRNHLRLWNEIARALVWGVGFSALGVLAYKFYLVDGEWWMPALVITFSALLGCRNAALKRSGAFDAALDADQTLHLNDRLASALAFTHPDLIRQRHHPAPAKRFLPRLRAVLFPRPAYATATPTLQTALVPALIHDAAMRVGTLNPKTVYPLRFGRPQKALLGATLAFGGFGMMPNMTYLLPPEQRTDAKKTLPETGKKLQVIAKEVGDNKDLKNPETKKLGKKLMALGKRMERARMGKKEALVEMAQLREKIAQAAKKTSPQDFKAQLVPAQEELRQQQFQTNEGRKMQQHLDKGESEKAAQELEKLADKIEKGDLSKDEKEKAARDLEKAAQALRKQGGEQAEQMAQKLEQAAKALREQNQQQGQPGEKGKDGEKKPGQNAQQQQGQGQKQEQQKPGQNGQQQQGQKQGQQSQQGEKGQQDGEKQGQPQQSQNGQQQGQKQGQQGQQQQSGQQQGQQNQSHSGSQQAQQGGSQALRKMAEGMRSGESGSGQGQGQGSADSQSMQRMLDQIKEAERQAGSGSMGNPGSSPSQGQGGFGGQGDGQPSVTPGKDLKPTDPKSAGAGGAGLGRRDHIKGFNNKGGGLSDQRAKRTGDKRRWADVWAPKLPSTQKKISRIRGSLGQGEVEQLQTEGDPKGGPVKTPYYDVYDTYKKEADDAVGKEVVPPAYKQPVKDYFDSIKPSK